VLSSFGCIGSAHTKRLRTLCVTKKRRLIASTRERMRISRAGGLREPTVRRVPVLPGEERHRGCFRFTPVAAILLSALGLAAAGGLFATASHVPFPSPTLSRWCGRSLPVSYPFERQRVRACFSLMDGVVVYGDDEHRTGAGSGCAKRKLVRSRIRLKTRVIPRVGNKLPPPEHYRQLRFSDSTMSSRLAHLCKEEWVAEWAARKKCSHACGWRTDQRVCVCLLRSEGIGSEAIDAQLRQRAQHPVRLHRVLLGLGR